LGSSFKIEGELDIGNVLGSGSGSWSIIKVFSGWALRYSARGANSKAQTVDLNWGRRTKYERQSMRRLPKKLKQ